MTGQVLVQPVAPLSSRSGSPQGAPPYPVSRKWSQHPTQPRSAAHQHPTDHRPQVIMQSLERRDRVNANDDSAQVPRYVRAVRYESQAELTREEGGR